MSITADAAPTAKPPGGRPLRARLGRDDYIMRGYMLAIMVYLVVALAMPLYVMLSKSFTTYGFDLATYEFQVSDEAGNFSAPPVSAEALNRQLDAVPPAKLATSADGRLPATLFFPDFSFRSPVLYRIRGTTGNAVYLIGSERHSGTE